MTYTQVAPWYNATSTVDSGISRLGAASLAIGNGTAGDFSGSLKLKSVLITDTAANADLIVQNTTVATSSTTNASPLLELAANYWTGSASAQDLWSVSSSLLAGSNGTSSLAISHTGSTGNAFIPLSHRGTVAGTIQLYATPQMILGSTGNLTFNCTGAGVSPALTLAMSGILTNSSGNIVRVNSIATFSPASGNATFTAFDINPTINQSATSTGGYTGLLVNVVETSLKGASNFLIVAQAGATGGTTKFSVDNSGNVNLAGTGAVYQAQGISGVTQSAEAVGTIATTGGIVTTFTAVSDERLKISQAYDGGLAEILGIVPIRYRWNEKGQSLSGQTGDRDYVGFSAQNVERSIPESIQSKKGPEQYLSFDDRPVIAALVNAVKTLEARIKVLESQ
jgi:hypothetical protein